MMQTQYLPVLWSVSLANVPSRLTEIGYKSNDIGLKKKKNLHKKQTKKPQPPKKAPQQNKPQPCSFTL